MTLRKARDAIGQRARHGVGKADQYRTDDQRGARVHLPVDQELRHRIQHNPDGNQIANAGKCAAQQFLAILRAHDKAIEIRGPPRPGIAQACTQPQAHGDQGLKHEAEPPWTGFANNGQVRFVRRKLASDTVSP